MAVRVVILVPVGDEALIGLAVAVVVGAIADLLGAGVHVRPVVVAVVAVVEHVDEAVSVVIFGGGQELFVLGGAGACSV